jgi:hypothetical protein
MSRPLQRLITPHVGKITASLAQKILVENPKPFTSCEQREGYETAEPLECFERFKRGQ